MNRNKGVLMNTRFEKSVRSSDEWYTPKEVLKALGRFDLDPCATASGFTARTEHAAILPVAAAS